MKNSQYLPERIHLFGIACIKFYSQSIVEKSGDLDIIIKSEQLTIP